MVILQRAAVFAALFLLALSPALRAQDVSLTSRDGRIEIVGTLLGFDGEFYRIQTEYGELTVDGSGVNCHGPACPNLQHFVAEMGISGSATIGAVMLPALVEAFARKAGYSFDRLEISQTQFTYLLSRRDTKKLAARFHFHVTNTDEGFADLLADDADVVMSMREINTTERQMARAAGLGDMTGPNRSRVIALDALVPVVAPNNPLRKISPLNLAHVFSGKITNWKDLGGEDAAIALHLPSRVDGLGQAIVTRVLGPVGLTLTDGITFHDTPAALSSAVGKDVLALGITSFTDRQALGVLTLTGACGFALAAARRTIKTEDYPLTAPMFLYLPARRLPQIGREFLAFTRGPAAQLVIRRAGFVDQSPEEIRIEEQGNRLANAIAVTTTPEELAELRRLNETLSPLSRLSVSFRFEAGSTRLDAQSRSNVQQLARALEVGRYDARALTFVGFSDGNGAADANREIALKRAETVRAAVVQAALTANLDRVELGVDAFGEALPMACDDSAWGRQANRRVEVWVR